VGEGSTRESAIAAPLALGNAAQVSDSAREDIDTVALQADGRAGLVGEGACPPKVNCTPSSATLIEPLLSTVCVVKNGCAFCPLTAFTVPVIVAAPPCP